MKFRWLGLFGAVLMLLLVSLEQGGFEGSTSRSVFSRSSAVLIKGHGKNASASPRSFSSPSSSSSSGEGSGESLWPPNATTGEREPLDNIGKPGFIDTGTAGASASSEGSYASSKQGSATKDAMLTSSQCSREMAEAILNFPGVYTKASGWLGPETRKIDEIEVAKATLTRCADRSVVSGGVRAEVGVGTVEFGQRASPLKVVCARLPKQGKNSSNALTKSIAEVFQSVVGKGHYRRKPAVTRRVEGDWSHAGQNLCLPIWGRVYGFGLERDTFGVTLLTEAGTHSRDLKIVKGDLLMSSRDPTTPGAEYGSSKSDSDSVYFCTVAPGASKTAAKGAPRNDPSPRSVVHAFPVVKHFENIYHTFFRLYATMRYLSSLPTGNGIRAAMTDSRRANFYTDSGLQSCSNLTTGDVGAPVVDSLGGALCASGDWTKCAPEFAMLLGKPAVVSSTIETEANFTLKRDTYRKLAPAFAARLCEDRSERRSISGGEVPHQRSSDIPWLASIGVPLDLAKPGVESHPFGRDVGLKLLNQLRLNVDGGSIQYAPASGRCFDTVRLGWGEFLMHKSNTLGMTDQVKWVREAVFAYYYPASYFVDYLSHKKRLMALEPQKPQPHATFSPLSGGKYDNSAVEGLAKSAGVVVVRVLYIQRKCPETRCIYNDDVVVEALRIQLADLFVPAAQKSREGGGVTVHVLIEEFVPSQYSFAEQIRRVAESDIMVGVLGAGITLASMMKQCAPHCVLVEIAPPSLAFGKPKEGWNNNLGSSYGSNMALGKTGDHLMVLAPQEWRCHMVVKNGTDCVTYTNNGGLRPISDYPPGIGKLDKNLAKDLKSGHKMRIKVLDVTKLVDRIRSAVCMHVLGRVLKMDSTSEKRSICDPR